MKALFLALSLILALAPGFARAGSGTVVDRTEAVWKRHIDAWNARDLAAIAADYARDSILIVNGAVFRGPEEIRNAFAQLFSIFDRGENQIDTPVLEGRVIFLTWYFSSHGAGPVDGTDSFVVEDGKIRVQTIASRLYEQFPLKKKALY